MDKLINKVVEYNYISLNTVKRSLHVKENHIEIDELIIRPINKKEHEMIMNSYQKRYECGMSLDKISEKLYFLFNWKVFEYEPMEKSLERYKFYRSYYSKILEWGNEREEYRYVEGMINLLEEREKNRPKSRT